MPEEIHTEQGHRTPASPNAVDLYAAKGAVRFLKSTITWTTNSLKYKGLSPQTRAGLTALRRELLEVMRQHCERMDCDAPPSRH